MNCIGIYLILSTAVLVVLSAPSGIGETNSIEKEPVVHKTSETNSIEKKPVVYKTNKSPPDAPMKCSTKARMVCCCPLATCFYLCAKCGGIDDTDNPNPFSYADDKD
ncbi:uncharacterized protein LOC126839825 [Adelges cooleyi]|uniref:uncharacterized protein LOC126839825 n=1 Tax=Adelges cooleyi TaxID=133065 RepID=UPI00217FABCA|nr:uncharacterized protein LOC126839825 [Adelges cooleyi]XP_050431210.1 uncharacterized protein LOC126839825 [Adelges cooleyi]